MTAIAIVDTSYVIFAKYYATLSWYKSYVRRDADVVGLLSDAAFKGRYCRAFIGNVERVCHAMQVDPANVVFAKDCNKDSVWRRRILPAYKASRTHNNQFNREVFRFTYQHVLAEWARKHTPGQRQCIVGAEGAEADDVIAAINAHVRGLPGGVRAVILTNDNDCIQLAGERTEVVNLVLQDVGARRGTLTPREYLTYRVIMGDRSDNIPGVVPKGATGRGGAQRIVDDADAILDTHREETERNDLLMNLERMPDHIRSNIIASFLGAFPEFAHQPDSPEP
jgi:5'-3' exonuclease